MRLSRRTLEVLLEFLFINANREFYNEAEFGHGLYRYLYRKTRSRIIPEFGIRQRKTKRKVDFALFNGEGRQPSTLIEVKYGDLRSSSIIEDFRKLAYIRGEKEKILIGLFDNEPDYSVISSIAKKTRRSRFVAILLMTMGLVNFPFSHVTGWFGRRKLTEIMNVYSYEDLIYFYIDGPVLIVNFEISRYSLSNKILSRIEKTPILKIPNRIRGKGGRSVRYVLRTPIEYIDFPPMDDYTEYTISNKTFEFFLIEK